VSITLDSVFCIDAVEEAIDRHGCPAIFNTDQGSQFTSAAFTGMLKDRGIRISMDGRGCWRDNIFVERLWRSLKYEEVYLHAYDSVSVAKECIGRYFRLYNTRRPHSSLADRTPDESYFSQLPVERQHDPLAYPVIQPCFAVQKSGATSSDHRKLVTLAFD